MLKKQLSKTEKRFKKLPTQNNVLDIKIDYKKKEPEFDILQKIKRTKAIDNIINNINMQEAFRKNTTKFDEKNATKNEAKSNSKNSSKIDSTKNVKCEKKSNFEKNNDNNSMKKKKTSPKFMSKLISRSDK